MSAIKVHITTAYDVFVIANINGIFFRLFSQLLVNSYEYTIANRFDAITDNMDIVNIAQ